jgi:DMPK coiled coil domain like
MAMSKEELMKIVELSWEDPNSAEVKALLDQCTASDVTDLCNMVQQQADQRNAKLQQELGDVERWNIETSKRLQDALQKNRRLEEELRRLEDRSR